MARLDLDTFASSRFGLKVAAGIGRAAPPTFGHRIAATAARFAVGDSERALVQAVRANQWVASGCTLLGDALDERSRATIEHMARCVYDYYHLLDRPERLKLAVEPTPQVAEWLERGARGESLIFAAPHLSNFDLVGRALALGGMQAQVLSVPDPTNAYQTQNDVRRDVGLDMTPLSLATIKTAEERLNHGGIVITGIDRPAPGVRRHPRFFGRPTELPVVHVRLAMRTGATMLAFLIRLRDDGVYEVDAREVSLERGAGDEATTANAEAVLAIAEEAIRANPQQWAMPHAVWPEATNELNAAEAGN